MEIYFEVIDDFYDEVVVLIVGMQMVFVLML